MYNEKHFAPDSVQHIPFFSDIPSSELKTNCAKFYDIIAESSLSSPVTTSVIDALEQIQQHHKAGLLSNTLAEFFLTDNTSVTVVYNTAKEPIECDFLTNKLLRSSSENDQGYYYIEVFSKRDNDADLQLDLKKIYDFARQKECLLNIALSDPDWTSLFFTVNFDDSIEDQQYSAGINHAIKKVYLEDDNDQQEHEYFCLTDSDNWEEDQQLDHQLCLGDTTLAQN